MSRFSGRPLRGTLRPGVLLFGFAIGSTHCAQIMGLTDHELKPGAAGAGGQMSQTAGRSDLNDSGAGMGGGSGMAAGGNGGFGVHSGGAGGNSNLPVAGAGTAGDSDLSPCASSSTDADAGASSIPKSCRSGATGAGINCGPGKNIDCCASLEVTGGPDECLPGSNDVIETFMLDKFEVTIGRFKEFMKVPSASRTPADGAGTHPKGANHSEADQGWDAAWNDYLPASSDAKEWYGKCASSTWTQPTAAAERDLLPASCISWFEAQAFCIWDGGYLPSWSELSYAAKGGSLNYTYPWGTDSIDSAHAVYESSSDQLARPVGSLPAGNGRWLHSDLAGNVWEWCSYNAFNGAGDCSAAPCRCNDMNQGFDHARAFGGSYGAQPKELKSTYFATGEEPTSGGLIFLKPEEDWGNLVDVGFRCARRPLAACPQ